MAGDHLKDREMETAASAKERIRDFIRNCLFIRSTHGNLIVTLPSSRGEINVTEQEAPPSHIR